MAGPNIKEIIRGETFKCLNDESYFVNNYCYIAHPKKGEVLFHFYPFQEDTLQVIKKNRYSIILKSRQLGISTLVAAHILWLTFFFPTKNVAVFATTQDVAKNMVDKVKLMYDKLPEWLKKTNPTVEKNKLSILFSNGSRIKTMSSATSSGRSEALSLLVIDEAAFIDRAEEIWTSAQQTLATGGDAIVLSCVTKDTFVFTDKGIQQVNSFVQPDKKQGYIIDPYEVLGKGKLRRGNLFHNNGIVPTKIIKTPYSKLEGSFNHKLFACKEGKYDWFRLDELSQGDWVCVQHGMQVWGTNDDVSDFVPYVSPKIKNKFGIKKLTPDICYILGLFIAEGSTYLTRNSHGEVIGGAITITCGDDISEALRALDIPFYTDGLRYTLSSLQFINFLQYLGFDLDLKAKNKIIPNRLLQCSKENISAILQGIFDGDGSHSIIQGGNRISIGLSSEKLIEQIRVILINYGILSTYFSTITRPTYKVKVSSNSYRLEINGSDCTIFMEQIGFRFQRKNLQLVNKKYRANKRTIPYSLNIFKEMFLCTPYTINQLRSLGLNLSGQLNNITPWKTEHISHRVFEKLFILSKDYLSSELLQQIDKIYSPNMTWCKITSIEESENETFDFSLPDDSTDDFCHSVCYNGIIGHQTPNGVGNWFHQQWVKATSGLKKDGNTFVPIRLKWTVHPDRDQKWRDEQTDLLGPQKAAQECDADFLSSGNSVVDAGILQWYLDNQTRPPIEKRGFDGGLWIWEYPDPTKKYVITADVARGDGTDYSAFHIIEPETFTQVAEYQGQIGTKEYAQLLVSIGYEYNQALIVSENNNIGWTVVEFIQAMNYPNMFFSLKEGTLVDTQTALLRNYDLVDRAKLVPGFTTSTRTRPIILSKLPIYFKDKIPVVNSERLINELFTFIWKNSRPEAQQGYNDDLVMSFAIGLWIRDTALVLKETGNELTKKTLDLTSQQRPIYTQENRINNPWQIKVGRNETEDLRWLIR